MEHVLFNVCGALIIWIMMLTYRLAYGTIVGIKYSDERVTLQAIEFWWTVREEATISQLSHRRLTNAMMSSKPGPSMLWN